MAKTDWQIGDTVQPGDLNQLGQEINDNTADLANHKSAEVLDHPDGSVTTEKLADGAVTAAKVASDVAKTADLNDHTDATSGVHGATSAALANRIIQRDAAGRAKVAAPAAADDIARKAETDAAMAAAQAAQATANAALPKSGGTVTGTIRTEGGQIIQRHTRPQHALVSSSTNEGIRVEYREDQRRFHWQSTDGNGGYVASLMYLDRQTGELYLTPSGHKAWHAGNMSPNVNASANTIVQRDNEGNIRAAKRIYFSNDDYIEFDDSTDTFSFKDDGNAGAQDSNIIAGRIRLTSTGDVSETSTTHAFQIGPSDGVNLRIDANELMPLNNGVRSAFDINSIRTNIANTLLVDKETKKGTINGNEIWHLGNLPQTRVLHRHDTDSISQSASITSWPIGISYMRTETHSWVEGLIGSVVTIRVTNQTGFQLFIPTDDAYLFYIRSTAAGEWKPWRVLGTFSGSGNPEGNVVAPPGAIYTRTDANNMSSYRLYLKKANWGNTGWIAIG